MKPAAAALQLTRVWRDICPNDDPYPVDCRLVAEALNIKVHGEPIDDRFEAQLRIRMVNGRRRPAIIYNENIREAGRKNFCIAHEIGHHSCGTDQIPVIYLYTHERLRPEAHSARGQVVQ